MSTHCTEQRNSCLYKRHKQIVFHIKQGRCLQSYEHQFMTFCSDKFTPYIFCQTMRILCDHEMFFGIGLLCMLFLNFFSLFELTVSAENCQQEKYTVFVLDKVILSMSHVCPLSLVCSCSQFPTLSIESCGQCTTKGP